MPSDSPGWLERLLDRLRGRPVVRTLSRYRPTLESINSLENELAILSGEALGERGRRLRAKVRDGALLDSIVVEGFALVREASRRTLGQRPYDVQLLAGLVLYEGDLAEMATGEGKTLAAVAPAWLHALAGRGAHVLTFNDYLARRDAEWMAPIYQRLGVSVGVVQEGMAPAERRRAYRADVTYATAKEAGFDHLRAFLCRDRDELVQRPFHYAIVDEADSILIDEARVPLVIAGELQQKASSVRGLTDLVSQLQEGKHYESDEHGRNVNLNEAGYVLVEKRLGCGSLLEPPNLELLTMLNCALHARVLLRRDVDYIVRDDRIELVDGLTGRVVDDRHLPDGLQAAVEAKEGVTRGSAGTILGSVTLQHFLCNYPKLAGMTATAHTAAEELYEFYGLTTVVIPPNRPSVRVDHPDVVFTHREAMTDALVDEIHRVHDSGRPILVGTATVKESEDLASRLRSVGIGCEVLNAKRDDLEAQIVAEAGAPGAVTISTNMAGRGTDIRLGDRDESARERVVELGGLYVIGTNRHESRRIDLQLRGRAGRQGDPGSTRFFVSLEDPLISRFGVSRLIPRKHRPRSQQTSIDHPVIHREIGRAQRIVDGENLEIRRTLTRYAQMVEEQRQQIHRRRQRVLAGADGNSFLASESPQRYRSLRETWGSQVVEEAERQITLARIDRTWREHLAHAGDLRESIHLMTVARLDPLAEFQKAIIEAWNRRWQELDGQIVETFERVQVGPGGADLEKEGLQAPSSTWTYVVSDDPFRDQLFTRIGGTTMGIGIVVNFPIVLAWWLYTRFIRKSPRTGSSLD
jgi:preprotein translocase subunit SecA